MRGVRRFVGRGGDGLGRGVAEVGSAGECRRGTSEEGVKAGERILCCQGFTL